MKTEIYAITIDQNGYEEYRRDFDTLKEARAFIKESLLNAKFWDRRAEVDGYYKNIATVQLLKGEEVAQDWFPFSR